MFVVRAGWRRSGVPLDAKKGSRFDASANPERDAATQTLRLNDTYLDPVSLSLDEITNCEVGPEAQD